MVEIKSDEATHTQPKTHPNSPNQPKNVTLVNTNFYLFSSVKCRCIDWKYCTIYFHYWAHYSNLEIGTKTNLEIGTKIKYGHCCPWNFFKTKAILIKLKLASERVENKYKDYYDHIEGVDLILVALWHIPRESMAHLIIPT